MSRDSNISHKGPGSRFFWRATKVPSNDVDLQHVSDVTAVHGGTIVVPYRTYKRRWFGLAQLVLMNIVVSWDVRVSLPSLCSLYLLTPFP